MLRILAQYLGVLTLGLCTFLLLINASPSPERVILGEWKEKAWAYEMVDDTSLQSVDYKKVENFVRTSFKQDFVVHKAETWTFLPNGRLKLTRSGFEEIVTWKMKGRGHVLEIVHADNTKEHYNLTELDDNKMVLNFDSDMHVRGIAKLTFEKL